MSDLDTALRSMLGERAQDVTSVPPAVLPPAPNAGGPAELTELSYDGVAQRSGRHRYAPGAVAASIVGMVTLALVGLALRSPGDRDAGFPDARTVCTTTLPVAWQNALSPAPLRIDGYTPMASAAARNGRVLVSWVDDHEVAHWAVVDHVGVVLRRYTAPAGRIVAAADIDDNAAVFRVAPGRAGRTFVASSGKPWIVVVDIATGTRRRLPALVPKLFHGAEQPVLKDDLAIQNDTVYWAVAASLHGQGVGMNGDLIAYSIRTKRLRVVREIHGYADVGRDGRGVFWNAGGAGIPARSLPLSVPRYGTRYDWTWSDGSSFAWNGAPYGRQWMAHVLAWAGPDDEAREFRIDLEGSADPDHNDAPVVGRVSGHFVFFSQEDSPKSGNWVLDTRTGAVASVPLDASQGLNLSASNGLVTFGRLDGSSDVLVDLHGLPDLHC